MAQADEQALEVVVAGFLGAAIAHEHRHGARLDLIHVLSREPRDVELFSGRLDADRLRRLLPLLVPLQALDHVWIKISGARCYLTK